MTKERRSFSPKNIIATIGSTITVIAFIVGTSFGISGKLNAIENNTEKNTTSIMQMKPQVESHEKRIDSIEIQNARLETKLDHIIDLLEKADK